MGIRWNSATFLLVYEYKLKICCRYFVRYTTLKLFKYLPTCLYQVKFEWIFSPKMCLHDTFPLRAYLALVIGLLLSLLGYMDHDYTCVICPLLVYSSLVMTILIRILESWWFLPASIFVFERIIWFCLVCSSAIGR